MLQLILKHIIRSSAIHPAAIWITSKNSTYHPPSSTLPPKKIRKTDSCQSSWVFYIHHTVEQCGFCVYKAVLLTYREQTGSLSLNFPSPDIFQVLPCWTTGNDVQLEFIYYPRDSQALLKTLWVTGPSTGLSSSASLWQLTQIQAVTLRWVHSSLCFLSWPLSPWWRRR